MNTRRKIDRAITIGVARSMPDLILVDFSELAWPSLAISEKLAA